MKITKPILGFNYIKSKNKIDKDYIYVSCGIERELSLGQAKQLKIWLGKILNKKRPKKLKFRSHSFCYPPYVDCYYYSRNGKSYYTLYIENEDLNDKDAKKIYKWLCKYV
jgi:hypothetical protein